MSDNNDNRDWKDPANDQFSSPTGSWPRKEPMLGGFDDDEPLEEPDRDNDFNALYSDVDEEEELDAAERAFETRDDRFTTDEDYGSDEDWQGDEPEASDNPWPSTAATGAVHDEALERADDVEEDWEEEEYEEPPPQPTWPLAMIAVAALALVLLAAGGYGVMEQRSAMQEEIRQLQASLATSASPEEVAASRQAVTDIEQRNTELQGQVDSLSLENRQLRDTVTGLESQLTAQAEALAQAKAPPAAPQPAPAPKPAAQPKPAPQPVPAASAVSSQGWFVNFGSYSQKGTADSWAARLKPDRGDVVVTTGSKDGRIFYRVRVVNLPSREEAQQIARQLEQAYSLDRLWVGRQ